MGVTWFQFKIPLAGLVQLSPEWTPLLTALWVIAITNAVNLIDGLDGLAAGVVAIASGALAVYGLHLQHLGTLPSDNIGPLIAVITCGICLGFLPHNFHPAKIFMGDVGALLLGLLMAASTMLIGGRAVTTGPVSGVAAHTGQTYFFFAPLFIPFFILGVPIVDMAFAFVRRTANRTGFATPDKNHLHHRLLRLGHGHRRSVLILWAWTVLLSGFILFPLYISSVNAVIPFGALALGVVLYTLFHPSLRRQIGPGPEGEAPLETPVVPEGAEGAEGAAIGTDAQPVAADNSNDPDNRDSSNNPEEPVTSLPRPPGGRAPTGLGVRPVTAGSSRASRPSGSTGGSGEV
jgi:UDP-GlcNAc:undecaprenyl-phosphate GlcNAc-1-phosphate transferase